MIGNIFQAFLIFILSFLAYKIWKKDIREDPGVNEEERLKRTVKEVWSDIMGQVDSSVNQALGEIRSAIDLSNLVKKLREELSTLQIIQSKKEEEWARKEREIEHKVGLERKRQEQELTIEKSRLEVEFDKRLIEAEKVAIAAERSKFEEHIKFVQDRFEEEVRNQRDLIERLVGDVSRNYKEVRKDNTGSV
jgi:hypothetical protein